MGGLISNLCNSQSADSKIIGTEPEPITIVPTGDALSQQISSSPIQKKNSEGKHNQPEQKNQNCTSGMSYTDYDWIKEIGRGAFGRVALVRKHDNQNIYAMKIINKKDFNVKSTIDNAMTEREILIKSDHPFIVKLRFAFQDDACLYYCMDYVPGGELFKYLKSKKKFSLDEARFYATEVLLAIEYLHNELNVVYRDLKPENVLVNSDGHIKLTDFGLSKSRTMTNSKLGLRLPILGLEL